MTSLPVPLSPVMSMVTSLGAMRSTVRTTSCMAALLENRRGRAAHGFQRAPQGAVFLALLLVLDGALHVGQQLAVLERLGEKIIRAALGRLPPPWLHRGLAGQHDDFGVGPAFFDLRQQLQAVGVAADSRPAGSRPGASGAKAFCRAAPLSASVTS